MGGFTQIMCVISCVDFSSCCDYMRLNRNLGQNRSLMLFNADHLQVVSLF